MKRRFYSKVSIFVCIALLFCCMPFRVVKASNIQDQSKPIFGLTADDVVEKYNQLSDQQKDQVLRSLGNTSIFANSLFGNIFNSTFGALDDAVKKLGDLFFQANGVVYKLGSSALAWLSRLIDKVFNNDLNDLNISQPVIDDLYLNTKNLVYTEQPFFSQPNYATLLPSYVWGYAFPLPAGCDLVYCIPAGYWSGSSPSLLAFDLSSNKWNLNFGLICNTDTKEIYLGSISFSTDNLGNSYYMDSYKRFFFDYIMDVPSSPTSLNWYHSEDSYINTNWYISYSGSYQNALRSFLNTYCVICPYYYLVQDGYVLKVYFNNNSTDYNVTNNTYYNYIYNIPNQTPLNVTNIVSNTAIDYNPVDNIAYYLPDEYNIEQNFSVVNNYYLSSGSAITTGSPIDVNLVSPSVIDVRITNPEDISNLVENNTIKQIINNNEFNAGDLNLNTTISTVIDSSNDSLSVVSNDSVGLISAFYSCIPSDLMGLYVVEVIVGIVVIWLNVVNHKHK